ncbi:hypothetical protein AB0I66_21430 [Streptomyces sp. NPDC050439]|uniref:hypothetical protein n=1 Tax=unclassified Streptomyces TaxID=2593676 RepID=UPI003440EBCF
MPWFALDDGFDTHPKVRKAGNAAVGLFVRLGVHATKHLTEGHLDGAIVRDYGTAATIRKLVTVGMLHEPGHPCRRCPQPADNGFYIHDYLDYNKSRAQIEAAREAARKRQQRGRDNASLNRNARDSDAILSSKSRQNDDGFTPNSRQNAPQSEGSTAGQSGTSRRDTHEGATGVPSPPIPSPPVTSGAGRERSDRSSARDNATHSLITDDWHPSHADLDKARADLDRLGPAGAAAATAKFVRHHTAKATHAADFGPLWLTWLTRERPTPPTQGTFLVGLPGGGATPPTPTPPSYAQRMRQLDAAAEADRRRDRETGEAG